jgi:hypothetical protein
MVVLGEMRLRRSRGVYRSEKASKEMAKFGRENVCGWCNDEK